MREEDEMALAELSQDEDARKGTPVVKLLRHESATLPRNDDLQEELRASAIIPRRHTTMAAPRQASALAPSVCRSCRHHLSFRRLRRNFTAAAVHRADQADSTGDIGDLFRQVRNAPPQPRRRPIYPYPRSRSASNSIPSQIFDALDSKETDLSLLGGNFPDTGPKAPEQPHRLHVFAHKHNTHITFVQPPKPASQTPHLQSATSKTTANQQNKEVSVLLSLSTGNIGFKKAGRGSYDAAFQLAAFTLKQIQEKGMGREVKDLEVVLRGFGAGREAVTKALLGTEGRFLRPRIVSVADATRLKQGGSRAKKPRRLG